MRKQYNFLRGLVTVEYIYYKHTGHSVVIVDNLSRRKIDVELGCESLTPIAAIEERCRIWNSIPGSRGEIKFECLDLQHDYAELVQVRCVFIQIFSCYKTHFNDVSIKFNSFDAQNFLHNLYYHLHS